MAEIRLKCLAQSCDEQFSFSNADSSRMSAIGKSFMRSGAVAVVIRIFPGPPTKIGRYIVNSRSAVHQCASGMTELGTGIPSVRHICVTSVRETDGIIRSHSRRSAYGTGFSGCILDF
jgi:hypothetical protein